MSDILSADLVVEFEPTHGGPTPLRMQIDFAPLLAGRAGALVDPHSIVVKRKRGSESVSYPVQFAETLFHSNDGWIAWLVDEPEAGGEWSIEFSARATSGALSEAPYLPIVGVGEELSYNGDRWQPIAAPGRHPFPQAVDWDGDGLIDIICASHHSNVIGMPWGAIFCWRNIGSNAEPRFGPPLRLSADGVDQSQPAGRLQTFEARHDFISEDYISCDTFDWYGTGRPDLMTISQRGGIKVYRNRGTLDAAGLPVLELGSRVAFPEAMGIGRYLHMRVVDWDGSGRPSLVLGTRIKNKQHNGEREQIFLMLNDGKDPSGDWQFRSMPFPISGSRIFGPDNRIADWRECNFTSGRALSFDVADVDGDGNQELLCCHVDHIPEPLIEVWRNVGSAAEPELMHDGVLPWSVDVMAFGFRFVRNEAFQGCIRASWYNNYGFHYFEQVGENPFQPDSFRDNGPLLGEGCKVKHEGMVKADPMDTRGDGRFDLLCSDMAGYVTLVRNIGAPGSPAYARPERVTDANGVPLRVYRDLITPDNNSERRCGHLKPFLCDWDGDGANDLIVGNNTNRIVWIKGYDPVQNRYDEWLQLRVRGLYDPFGSRKGPAVADYDGDGRLELLTVDSQGRFSAFKQGSGADGALVLEPPTPLRFANGKVVMNSDIGRALAKAEGKLFPSGLPGIWQEPAVTLAVCDWTGSGTLDLAVSSNWYTFIMENVGTDAEPRYGDPEPLCDEHGMPIKISQHESHVSAYDWDGDGRPDLIVGGESGGLYFFHHDWVAGIYHRAEIRIG